MNLTPRSLKGLRYFLLMEVVLYHQLRVRYGAPFQWNRAKIPGVNLLNTGQNTAVKRNNTRYFDPVNELYISLGVLEREIEVNIDVYWRLLPNGYLSSESFYMYAPIHWFIPEDTRSRPHFSAPLYYVRFLLRSSMLLIQRSATRIVIQSLTLIPPLRQVVKRAANTRVLVVDFSQEN